MPTYFKPLRRKIGVVTLVVALAALIVWIKTFNYTDTLCVRLGRNSLFAVQSGLGGIRAIHILDDEHGLMLGRAFYTEESTLSSVPSLLPNSRDRGWQWNGFQFEQGHQEHTTDVGYRTVIGTTAFRMCRGIREITVLGIPHAAIAIPLTLLSAWLLLSKPRAGRLSIESPPKPEP